MINNRMKGITLICIISLTLVAFYSFTIIVYANTPPENTPPENNSLGGSAEVTVVNEQEQSQNDNNDSGDTSGCGDHCGGDTPNNNTETTTPSGNNGQGKSDGEGGYYSGSNSGNNHYIGDVTSSTIQEGDWTCSPTGCSIISGVSEHTMSLKWDLYDMFNEPLTSKFGVLAGTHIGANLCESRKAVYYGEGYMNYSCTREVKEIVTDCVMYPTRGPNDEPDWGYHCESYTRTRIERESRTYAHSGCNEAALQDGYNTALFVLSGKESYTVDISDPNEAKCYDKPDGYKYGEEENQVCKTYHAVSIGGVPTSYAESRNNGNTVIKNYCYELYGSCINVKTGKVEYLTEPVSKEDENPCRNKGDEWYYVKNDYKDESDRHWHIFIPLNTKETDVYQFAMKSKSKENSSQMCRAFIEKYSKDYEYTKYIVPAVGSFNKNKSDINLVKNGCYYKSTVTIPIRQRFYNEVDSNNKDTSELIGFNFYYRPISLDNPFPNGITKYSDWEKWNENKKQGKENPELDKSFNTVTYAAANINLSYIRNYNKENLYTDWSKMNIDGSSIFIQKDNIIDRNGLITNKTFYSLGCGIENQCEYLDKERKIKNPIYQPRCKNNKTNDTCPTSSYK